MIDATFLDCLKINVPDLFEDEDFREWLNGLRDHPEHATKIATWHKGGIPTEYSDIFMTYDQGEGSDFGYDDQYGLPQRAQERLTVACKVANFKSGLLWLTNLKTS